MAVERSSGGRVQFTTGTVISDASGGNTGLMQARVSLSAERVEFALEDGGFTIPLEAIDDAAVGLPSALAERFERGLRIRWDRSDGQWTAIVAGEAGDIDRLACHLLAPLLEGTTVEVEQTRVPNRVGDAEPTTTTASTAIRLDDPVREVGFEDDDLHPVIVPTITNVDEGEDDTTVRIRHMRPEETLTTEVRLADGGTFAVFRNHLDNGCSIAPEAGSIRVLLVDDEPGLASIMADFLDRTATDMEVEVATSLTRAEKILAEIDIECIVSDFVMPNGTGMDLVEIAREEEPPIPFILLTRKGEGELPGEGIPTGVTEYYQKQLGTDQYETIARSIERIVADRRAS